MKNMRLDFVNPMTSSRLSSDHFNEDFFEPQTVILKSMGLKMKHILQPMLCLSTLKVQAYFRKRSKDGNKATMREYLMKQVLHSLKRSRPKGHIENKK